MKNILLFVISIALAFGVQAQKTQIGNSGFEEWENVSGGSEPVNWNSFLTANGSFNTFRANQIEKSTDVRPGSSGNYSVKIWSRSALSIVANGNITLGRIHMGSAIPTNSANYNRTVISEEEFNQVMPDRPDSLVFWVKFTPNGHNEEARVKATIHDDYEYRDPEDTESQDHIVGIAELNYSSTGGEWVRKSVPFVYDGPAEEQAYILLTFTTNSAPGGGKEGDEVWIDDVELIYNDEVSVSENSKLDNIAVYPNPTKNTVVVDKVQSSTEYTVTSVLGSEVANGVFNIGFNTVDLSNMENGVYFLRMKQNESIRTVRLIKN